ncbi:MAG: hypothetical protein V1894_05970 [Chloroflexota bacterium]
MSLKKGELVSFDAGSYTATVKLLGSDKAYLDGVSVARNIASSEMTAGRKVGVVFFDESNAREAVIIAVYTQG